MRSEPQPYVFASISPYVSANSPIPEVASPGKSRRSCVSSRVSSMKRKLAAIARMPTGTFTKKIQLQSACSVSSPPTSGPIASASADTPAQIPIAVPRWWSGKVAAMIDRVAGFMRAAPTPWSTRAAISSLLVSARPHQSDAVVKTAMPITKISRRP